MIQNSCCTSGAPTSTNQENSVPTLSPNYWEPTLCGGHCDKVSPPDFSSTDNDGNTAEGKGGAGERPSDRSKDEDSLLLAEGGTEATDKTQDACR